MRVLIAHNQYRLTGGEERHVDLLERGLCEEGIEVRRFETDSYGLAASRRQRLLTGVALTYRPGGGGIGSVMAEWEPDVVHFHNIWPLLTPSALRIAKRKHAAVVLTAHNYRFVCPSGMLLRNGSMHEDCIEGSSLVCGLRSIRTEGAKGLAYGVALSLQRRLRMLERWVDGFVAPSAFVRDILVRAGHDTGRIRVIPHGVPRVVSSEFPLCGSGHALYAGRLSREKGIQTLVEAARLVPEIPIVVAGAGPLGDELRRIKPRSISLVGQVEQSQLEGLRAKSCMSLMPSVCFETAGFAALESAAAGRPVVASRVGGLPEVVVDGETGLLVAPGNAAELAAAMDRLWHDRSLAAALGAEAAHRVRRHNDPGHEADQHVRFYRQLIARVTGLTLSASGGEVAALTDGGSK